MVSTQPTHLKNLSQIGNLPQIGVKIKNIGNHQPEDIHPTKAGTTLSRWFSLFPDTVGWYISCSSLPSNGDFIPRENIKTTNPFQSIQTMDSRKKSWHDAGLLNLCLENPSFSFWLLFEGSSFLPAFFPLPEGSGTSCSNKILSPCNGDNTKTHGRRQLCNLHWRKERPS